MKKAPGAQVVTADKTPECVPGSYRRLSAGNMVSLGWHLAYAEYLSIVLPVGLVTGTSTFSKVMVVVSHEPTQ